MQDGGGEISVDRDEYTTPFKPTVDTDRTRTGHGTRDTGYGIACGRGCTGEKYGGERGGGRVGDMLWGAKESGTRDTGHGTGHTLLVRMAALLTISTSVESLTESSSPRAELTSTDSIPAACAAAIQPEHIGLRAPSPPQASPMPPTYSRRVWIDRDVDY